LSLYRHCSQGHDLSIHFGVRFLPKRVVKGRKRGMKYFLVLNGKLIKQSSKLPIIEKAYVVEDKKLHKGNTGVMKIGKHKLKGGVVVE